jgi:hypothetical protein
MLIVLAACARTPPEQALREAMSDLQGAIEQRDAAAVGALLADDFIGPEGLDRDGARRLAQGLFLRYRDVGARIGPLDIAMQERHARVRFDAVVSGGAGALLPETGQIYDVDTGWRLEGGQWGLVSADWRPRLGSRP